MSYSIIRFIVIIRFVRNSLSKYWFLKMVRKYYVDWAFLGSLETFKKTLFERFPVIWTFNDHKIKFIFYGKISPLDIDFFLFGKLKCGRCAYWCAYWCAFQWFAIIRYYFIINYNYMVAKCYSMCTTSWLNIV